MTGIWLMSYNCQIKSGRNTHIDTKLLVHVWWIFQYMIYICIFTMFGGFSPILIEFALIGFREPLCLSNCLVYMYLPIQKISIEFFYILISSLLISSHACIYLCPKKLNFWFFKLSCSYVLKLNLLNVHLFKIGSCNAFIDFIPNFFSCKFFRGSKWS